MHFNIILQYILCLEGAPVSRLSQFKLSYVFRTYPTHARFSTPV